MDTELLAERFYYQALSVAPQIGEWPHVGPPQPSGIFQAGDSASVAGGLLSLCPGPPRSQSACASPVASSPMMHTQELGRSLEKEGTAGGGLCREEMVLRLALAGTVTRDEAPRQGEAGTACGWDSALGNGAG